MVLNLQESMLINLIWMRKFWYPRPHNSPNEAYPDEFGEDWCWLPLFVWNPSLWLWLGWRNVGGGPIFCCWFLLTGVPSKLDSWLRSWIVSNLVWNEEDGVIKYWNAGLKFGQKKNSSEHCWLWLAMKLFFSFDHPMFHFDNLLSSFDGNLFVFVLPIPCWLLPLVWVDPSIIKCDSFPLSP